MGILACNLIDFSLSICWVYCVWYIPLADDFFQTTRRRLVQNRGGAIGGPQAPLCVMFQVPKAPGNL